jgi:hypothetical protein
VSTAPFWVTAGTSLLAALVGGGIGAWSAHHVMRRSQAEERRSRSDDRRRLAAQALIDAFMAVKSSAFDNAGRRDSGDATVQALQRALSVNTPDLAGLDLEQRLADALLLVLVRDESVELTDVPATERTAVLMRVHADRRHFLDWVIASLQDVASGDAPPPAAEPPAPLGTVGARPWSPPVPPSPLTRGQRVRRTFSRSTEQ